MKTILSIDGDGVRGLISACVLEALEVKLQTIDQRKTLKNSFDLMVGTSTGD